MRAGYACVGAALLLLASCGDHDEALELDPVDPTDAIDSSDQDLTATQRRPGRSPFPAWPGWLPSWPRSPQPGQPPTPAKPLTPPSPTTPPTAPTKPPVDEVEPDEPEAEAPVADGSGPRIPAISGACPTFRNGTATIGGLGGISLQVGPKKNGTGSIIFYWHGTGSFAGESNVMLPASVRSEILNQGGIIVSPQSSRRTGGDCSGTATFSKDDFKVMDLIYACAVRDHGIDPRRAYTTGCSAGGLQAGCMASVRSSYIAAAVPNSGGIVFPQGIEDSKHVPALMTMHGSAADTVVVNFSQTSATLGSQFARAGGYVLNCNHGGGHCGAPATLQAAGWQFMKDHPFGAKPYAAQSGAPSGFPSYCKQVASAGGGSTRATWPF